MTTVNVIDAPCGYGKTSWAIQYMNSAPVDTHRFIYVTPFLTEVERVIESVQDRSFYAPTPDGETTKLNDLHQLLSEGKDIATTHALFQLANAETHELIRCNNYTLILDEVMNVIKQVPLKKDDLRLLFDVGAARVREEARGLKYIEWIDHDYQDTQYNKIKKYAQAGTLMYCEDQSALIWTLPCQLFTAFNQVFILTYLFAGQFQRYYYDLYDIQYRYFSVRQEEDSSYHLIPYNARLPLDKKNLASLINIYEGDLNKIGDPRTALSTSWFLNKPKLTPTLKRNAYNYLYNKCKANKDTALWRTVKGEKKRIQNKVQPQSYKNAFLEMTARATNDYDEKHHLAYLVNRFMNPIQMRFFEQYGVAINQEVWALSEMIQWIWRSRIRKGESINIYIPSSRMRGLIKHFLESE